MILDKGKYLSFIESQKIKRIEIYKGEKLCYHIQHANTADVKKEFNSFYNTFKGDIYECVSRVKSDANDRARFFHTVDLTEEEVIRLGRVTREEEPLNLSEARKRWEQEQENKRLKERIEELEKPDHNKTELTNILFGALEVITKNVVSSGALNGVFKPQQNQEQAFNNPNNSDMDEEQALRIIYDTLGREQTIKLAQKIQDGAFEGVVKSTFESFINS